MRYKLSELIQPFILTIGLLVVLDIISTSIIPALGIVKYKFGFHVLIILFLGLTLETPFLPFMILIIQLFHGVFTIESWAFGTFAGVLICMLIGQIKEFLHFNSSLLTIVMAFIGQFLWVLIISGLLYLKTEEIGVITESFLNFIPSGLILSILSPMFFDFLKRIWRYETGSTVGEI